MLVYDSKHCWDYFFLISGRFDLNKAIVQCTKCKTVLPSQSLTDVVQTGYWPGSPTDTSYLFDQRLFQLWDSIQKRMPGTSESSFVRALEDVSVMNGRVWFFIVFIFFTCIWVFVLKCTEQSYYISTQNSWSLHTLYLWLNFDDSVQHMLL